MERKYKLLWNKGNTSRYLINNKDGFFTEVQLGKYRQLNKQDKALGVKSSWHGKYYVDVFGKDTKLFNTKEAQRKYFKQLVERL
jgi:hypothetical protein